MVRPRRDATRTPIHLASPARRRRQRPQAAPDIAPPPSRGPALEAPLPDASADFSGVARACATRQRAVNRRSRTRRPGIIPDVRGHPWRDVLCGGGQEAFSLSVPRRPLSGSAQGAGYRPHVLAQQAQDTLSVGQTLLVASIPAAIALVGVIVTVAFGQYRAAKAAKEERIERQSDREHQRQIQRDEFLRSERISLYRSLAQSGSTALERSVSVDVRGGPTKELENATAAWEGAFAEARLVGAVKVTEEARGIDTVLRKRRADVRRRTWLTEMGHKPAAAAEEMAGEMSQPDDPPSPDPSTADTRPQLGKQSKMRTLTERLVDENLGLIDALLDACRHDIERPGSSLARGWSQRLRLTERRLLCTRQRRRMSRAPSR